MDNILKNCAVVASDPFIERLEAEAKKISKNTHAHRLFGVPIYKHNFTESVQRRFHRKKRINKKWRKRYGFKVVQAEKAFMIDTSYLNIRPDFGRFESFLPMKPPTSEGE